MLVFITIWPSALHICTSTRVKETSVGIKLMLLVSTKNTTDSWVWLCACVCVSLPVTAQEKVLLFKGQRVTKFMTAGSRYKHVNGRHVIVRWSAQVARVSKQQSKKTNHFSFPHVINTITHLLRDWIPTENGIKRHFCSKDKLKKYNNII